MEKREQLEEVKEAMKKTNHRRMYERYQAIYLGSSPLTIIRAKRSLMNFQKIFEKRTREWDKCFAPCSPSVANNRPPKRVLHPKS